MFEPIIRRVKKYLEARRKWNRTKRWLRERALYGRAAVALYHTGSLEIYR